MNLKLSLTASTILGAIKEVHQQNKQQFFAVKRPSRRVKHFKENSQETNSTYQSSQPDSQHTYSIIKKLQNLDVKELHYSLAQTQDPDNLLQFNTDQPKKRKLSSKIFTNQQSNLDLIDKDSQIFTQTKKSQKQINIGNLMIFEKQITNQSPFNIDKYQFVQKIVQKQSQLNYSQHKNIIPKTLTTLFSKKINEVKQKQMSDPTIHDFKIINKIGEGTYSKVFSVVHRKTGFLCALKIMQKKSIRQYKVEENAIRQIKILSCLSSHPNVTTLYGSFSDQNCIYLILELCTDGDVYNKIKKLREKQKKIDIKNQEKRKQLETKRMYQTVHILKQICCSLKYLHQHSIMHRDIKPQNIMVTMENNIKLSDFGWSVYNSKDKLRKTLCGTPLYLAPQFITTCKYNDAVDIWSLGIMAYELFTSQFPFAIRTVNDLVKIVEDQIKFEKIKCPLARDFCQKSLVKDRHYRADIWELYQHEIFTKYKLQD